MDADLFIARQVREACEKAGVRLAEASFDHESDSARPAA